METTPDRVDLVGWSSSLPHQPAEPCEDVSVSPGSGGIRGSSSGYRIQARLVSARSVVATDNASRVGAQFVGTRPVPLASRRDARLQLLEPIEDEDELQLPF